MWDLNPSYRFEIDNFSEKEAAFASHTFVSGGCEWFLCVYPKGHNSAENHLSLSLQVANPKSLPTGWKRSAGFYFLVLNQSEKVLHRTHVAPAANNLFCAKTPARTFAKTLLLSKLQEKGVLENDKLIVEVYVNVAEAIDGEGEEGEEDVSKMKETKTVEINGFRVLASRSTSLAKLFAEHPDIAKDFKPKNQVVKTEYMNVLLNLIETLDKPLKNQSNNELRKASSELSELMELGFKLDWLRSKLEELSLEMKKAEDDDQSRVQELEQRIKNLEMMDMGKLEERLKNIEVMELGIKMECLKSKFEEDSLERKQSYDADGSRVKQLEESVKNLEKIVSDLKVELDKEKDGFLVVGDVA